MVLLLSLDCSTLTLIRTLYCWVLSKEVSSTIFKVFGMTRPGIEPWSPGLLANTKRTQTMSLEQIKNCTMIFFLYKFILFIFFVYFLFVCCFVLFFTQSKCWYLSKLLRWSLIIFLRVGFRIRQETPKEGQRMHRPKRCKYNNRNEDNSSNTLNDKLIVCV